MDQFGYPPQDAPGPPGLPPARRRPAWVLPVAIGGLVGVVIALGGLVLLSGDDDEDPEETVSSESTDDSSEGDPTSTTEPAATDPDSLTGTWEGTYECAQGTAGLTLTLMDIDDTVDATFAFAPVAENPSASTGSYGMAGGVEGDTLSLTATAWIEESTGYQVAGIEADLADRSDPEALEGTVVGEGCTTFTVERTTAVPWYVGKWDGKYDCNQGRTGISLTVTETGDGAVEAIYDFYEVPENPGVPSGSYSLTGHYEDRSLVLEPDEWIDQPTGYMMVGISGEPGLVIGPDFLAGRVDDVSCEGFMLTKSADGGTGSG